METLGEVERSPNTTIQISLLARTRGIRAATLLMIINSILIQAHLGAVSK